MHVAHVASQHYLDEFEDGEGWRTLLSKHTAQDAV